MGEEGYAVKKVTTSEVEVAAFRRDVQELVRSRIRAAIEAALEEELTDALGALKSARTPTRRGYRNGSEERSVTTEAGTKRLLVPRGRVHQADGSTKEFESKVLPRYARRSRVIDDAILGCYLAGANTRRIRKALEPMLGTQHLSKSAVSRVVARLKELYASWDERDLSNESYPILFLDGFHLKVRMARRVVSVPALAVLGVDENGTKVLVALRLAASEAAALWSEVLVGLQRRGLRAPLLIVADGHAGLQNAIGRWPGARIQRCTQHKRQNLLDHCPVHARNELGRDYNKIVNAKDGIEARKLYESFLQKWSSLCPAVARSMSEAGAELLTFYEFPRAMWKSLRTTNVIENLNREFRRRTKSQASFATEHAAVTLLYGLVAFGQIRLRKIDGHHQMKKLLSDAWSQVA